MLLYYFIIRKSFKKLHNPTTFTIFAPMKRKIRTYGGYFEAFMETLKEKEQEKIQYGLLLLKSQDRLPKKFVKLVSSSTKARLWCFSTDSKRKPKRRH